MSFSGNRPEEERIGTPPKPDGPGKPPPELPKEKAGLILAYARVEFQVNRREITEAFGTSPEVIRTFESGLLPLNKSLWKGYVLGLSLHHDIPPERSDELLRELVHEILEHNDHRQSV